MNSINANEKHIWVVKDSRGLFAHRGSVMPSDGHTEPYIVFFKTFGEECRGYLTKEQAEEALLHLNEKKTASGLKTIFHLENNNLMQIIQDHKKFQKSGKENMVLTDEKLHLLPKKNKKLSYVYQKTALAVVIALTMTMTKVLIGTI